MECVEQLLFDLTHGHQAAHQLLLQAVGQVVLDITG